jgi:hypothetical protein
MRAGEEWSVYEEAGRRRGVKGCRVGAEEVRSTRDEKDAVSVRKKDGEGRIRCQ